MIDEKFKEEMINKMEGICELSPIISKLTSDIWDDFYNVLGDVLEKFDKEQVSVMFGMFVSGHVNVLSTKSGFYEALCKLNESENGAGAKNQT